MERNFHIDDFEEFLKEKADQYKMYPSDRVWNNIHRSVHPAKKWPYITLTLLLLLGTAIFVDTHNLVSINKQIGFSGNKINNQIPSIVASASKQAIKPNRIIASEGNLNETSQTALSSKSPSELLNKIAAIHHITDNNTNNNLSEEIEITNADQLPQQFSNKDYDIKSEDKQAGNATEGQEVKKVLWGGEKFKPSRIKWQLFFSPVVSYRRLSSDIKEVTDVFKGVPYSISQETRSVSSLVTHKPAVGAEVGANMVYKVTDNFLLKAGLQLNYTRYQVRAYATKPELTTLAPGAHPWSGDSVNVISTLKNYSGNGSSWFNNEYFQVSLPIGFEWGVLGNSTLRWNVAASAQPVYNVANNLYLLSTDFRRYGQDASLVRKWNINAGVETYVSYNMGSFRWQAGPQLRYQLLSSYQNKYPIKEYLVDYGFKIGVTKTIR